MHGNDLKYDSKVSHPNKGGVLATISAEAQKWYIDHVPESVRNDPQLQPWFQSTLFLFAIKLDFYT